MNLWRMSPLKMKTTTTYNNNIMNTEDLQHVRSTINTIDSLSIEIMELITDHEEFLPSRFAELSEALEATANAVTEFQEQQEWI